MNNKEIVLRMDAGAIAILEQEIKKKRDSGVANGISDTFLIRLLEATNGGSKVFLFKNENNKLIVRKYDTLNYDDNRQTRGNT